MKTPFQRFLEELPEIFAYETGTALLGITLRTKEANWLMVVTRMNPATGKEVAFIECTERMETYRYLYAHITARNAPLKWSASRY